MGVVWRVLPFGIADVLPLSRWPEAATERGAPEAWLTAASIWELGPYLRALEAVYDAAEPTVMGPKRWFPELSAADLQAVWEGELPAGVAQDRAREFYDAEIAVARTRPSGPGVPAFKLFENGPPWHVTASECADLVRITGERSSPELDPDPEREGWRQWQELAGLFDQGAAADGVITS
jgi:hypothetical protein